MHYLSIESSWAESWKICMRQCPIAPQRLGYRIRLLLTCWYRGIEFSNVSSRLVVAFKLERLKFLPQLISFLLSRILYCSIFHLLQVNQSIWSLFHPDLGFCTVHILCGTCNSLSWSLLTSLICRSSSKQGRYGGWREGFFVAAPVIRVWYLSWLHVGYRIQRLTRFVRKIAIMRMTINNYFLSFQNMKCFTIYS